MRQTAKQRPRNAGTDGKRGANVGKPTVQSADEFRASQGLPVKLGHPTWWDASGDADEKTVVREIVSALWFYGFSEPDEREAGRYFVLTQQRKAKGAGSTGGLPDLFVWVPDVPFSLAFEAKRRGKLARDKGRASPEQQVLIDAGCVYEVRTWREVMERVNNAIRIFSGETLKAVQAAMGRKL